MRVSIEKSKFFMTSVKYLEFVVSVDGIKTCPKKIETIVNYQVPTTRSGLRSFLGLAGYYRRYVREYDAIAKPLTKYLSGENGHIRTNCSKHVKISLDKDV